MFYHYLKLKGSSMGSTLRNMFQSEKDGLYKENKIKSNRNWLINKMRGK